jgi:membrane protease YdiL (CAAX protease family)
MMISSLVKVVLPLAAIAVVWLLAKYKYKFSLKEDLQLRVPVLGSLVVWTLIAIGWMLLTDWLIGWRGPWDFTPWKAQSVSVSIIRVLAVCFLGPIAEELIFRGLLMRRLIRSGKFQTWMVVVLLAAGWALLHYSYSPPVIFIIFIEGILLGYAAIRTRSVYVPIAMHIAWNLYAVW